MLLLKRRTKWVRAALPVALAAIFAACDATPRSTGSDGPVEPQANLLATFHRVTVDVTDPGNVPVPGILVTATNVNTGDYHISTTKSGGQAVLELTDGNYLVHARNLQDAGPAVPLPLALAPLPNGAGLLATGATEGVNRLGVLWDPNVPGGAVPLDPNHYSRLTLNPPLLLSGPPSSQSISLQFLAGATLNCSLIDGTGNPVALPTTENVFVVLPHGSGPLPPLPPALAGFNLPRGLLLGVATVPSGQSGCALAGFSQGPGGAVIETNAVFLGGKQVVFVGATPPSAAPSNTNITLVAEPQRSAIQYHIDPDGDASGGQDIGLVTYGWTQSENTPSDDFAVTARFTGAGSYLLDLRWRDPQHQENRRVRAHVECAMKGCQLAKVVPAGLAGIVAISGTTFTGPNGLAGAVTWSVTLPGVNVVEFNVLGGPGSDVAPDSGVFVGQRTNGGGNTWIIPGD